MTWKPTPQEPCEEPCCTGEAFTEPTWTRPVVVPDDPELRECGVTGCTHCDHVFVPSGGGDRLPYGRNTA